MTFPHLARDKLSFPAPPDYATVGATLQFWMVEAQSFHVEYALVRKLDAAAEMHVVLRNWILGQSYIGTRIICAIEKPSSIHQESTSGLDMLVTFDAAWNTACDIATGRYRLSTQRKQTRYYLAVTTYLGMHR